MRNAQVRGRHQHDLPRGPSGRVLPHYRYFEALKISLPVTDTAGEVIGC